MNQRILKMRPEHLPEILDIEKRSFPDPWSENMFREETKDDGRRIFLVLEIDGKISGYAVGWVVLDEFHLGNIALAAEKRRWGCGRRLLQEILQQAYRLGCRMASLEVRSSNEAAIELYKTFGFRPVAIRKKYYHNEDALVMMSDIVPVNSC
ncbi:MAG: ribosomal-protein-alanine N-acetyltransferase [Candidatus Edwardsbacteria bacterium RIFOXYD12_FULL_50_11]|uniref:[Ribosomal protein bS18]-alanine N-acetyltransferase n=1 Tax=Candidatus Edwardsbacteria bacterium GWF2_54_11 TaxID=1817851 RepID=A0A1F5RED0_9BACT|nr:MAG: ribosomal-protein-alanine N-acetyltransferase [Candidatus Edwardsbacteria bacterium RifOxyC12_full_54_24]OGF08236.1 MAG: ribosomal-protein-alanine N-acetyltransferase [Candidatus Edwardsbacteria bacterium RifOxyA12_full_54_48]OGF11533.1 MAG: ribosomal-protein-alanine N-acetyltransferase [Candidatus Edwardsbacteria bacterium GWE2_54_12]OGF12738.1 MAG: ribosomal-protein-alanine N-acetyltransferase [Candidatus Edwardsbacteria bacterium GWF2_54_11]OGF14835.1 MAG: ribosomal-protein-alanine N